MSTDKDVVKDTYWTYGSVSHDNSEIFLSIKTVVVELSANEFHGEINDKYNW
jgi:hypothetical protein